MALSDWWRDFIDLIFPRACLGCGKTDTWLCPLCLAQIQICRTGEQVCPVCKKPRADGSLCEECRRGANNTNDASSFLDGVLAASHFKGTLLQKILHVYKYQFVSDLSKPLGEILRRAIRDWREKLPAEHIIRQTGVIIMPVPLHKSRLKWRGFNQAELLAREVVGTAGGARYGQGGGKNKRDRGEAAGGGGNERGEDGGWALDTTSLVRKNKTLAQAHLDKAARAINLAAAFVCVRPQAVSGRKVILIDDVFTTGATLQAAAEVLKEAGAREVWGLVVAHE